MPTEHNAPFEGGEDALPSSAALEHWHIAPAIVPILESEQEEVA
jgi:hypothetical protein